MSDLALSVVMPAYNEEGAIAEAVREALGVVAQVPSGEVVVVNDGSRDRTGAILDALAADEPRLRVIHQANGGHGAALMRGLDAARGGAVLMLDSDRQIALDDFAAHWALFEGEGLKAVLGIRAERHDPFHRLVVTRGLRAVILALQGIYVRDSNIPYKLIRREVWAEVRPAIPDGTTVPSLLLAVHLMKRWKARVRTVEITHLPRRTGETVLNMRKLSRFSLRAAREIAAFRAP